MGTYLSTNPFPHSGTRTLEQCEEAVNVGTLMAGEAFKEIRDRRLYITVYGSGGFETYCQSKWHYSKRHVNKLIKAYNLYMEQRVNMGPMGPNFGERHYRELAKIKTKSARTAVVIEVRRRFGDNPRAEEVRQVVEEMLGERRKPTAPLRDLTKTPYDVEIANINKEYFMKIDRLEEDVERMVDDYGTYHNLEKVCDLIIETAARIKDEAKDEPKTE